jgi:subtilisin family serine protease
MTGRGVRVAVIDSGVHAEHPHVGGVAGGVAIDPDGREHGDYVDRIGHGTAVAAAIHDLAPDAAIYAVKVFDRALATHVEQLVRAIEWSAHAGMHVANLSLGTPRADREAALRAAIDVAAAHHMLIVAAREDEGVRYLPGSLAGVVPVQVDWTCARHEYRLASVDGATVVRTSGLPRAIPGVPPAKNLHGISFAVANATAFVACAIEGIADPTVGVALDVLRQLIECGVRAPRGAEQ